MCISDECDNGRRSFLTGTTGALIGLIASKSILAQQSQHRNAITRVLDDAGATHGPVMFQHQRKDLIGGYLARPAAANPCRSLQR